MFFGREQELEQHHPDTGFSLIVPKKLLNCLISKSQGILVKNLRY